MQKFNQEIQVTVKVDSIAQQLLDTMNPEFKHGELVVEAVIGRLLVNDMTGLSRLYNALNGYDNKINFTAGEIVKLTNVGAYGYWTPESIEANSTIRQSIETAMIIEINEHRDSPILIEYFTPKKDGTKDRKTEWIAMSQASEIPV